MCDQATPSVKPIWTPGVPSSDTPYTSSRPGMVRWHSQKRASPYQGKWGLASTMPWPEAVTSPPTAHPLLAPSPAAPAPPPSASTGDGATGPSGPGASARPMRPTRLRPLAMSEMSTRWA